MNFTANYAGVTYTHGYTLNDKNQRTGITLTDGKSWNFSYDNIGQVTGAMLNNSGNLLSNYSYNYDQIGNRIQATKDNNITSYTSNIVNQYTQINTAVPTYDQDGNMLTNGEWSYLWNGENRMISAQTTTRKVEFAYDYMGRCFERKEYTAENGSWNLDKAIYIVYDEYKQIAEYVNVELHQQYAWDVAGLDTVAFMGKNNSTYMYWTDGNKNVLKLFDATGILASYSYDPFGKVATSEGLLATDNPFRFSSEYHNDITGLVEYIYRKYDPVIGRWINRDPIEEQGSLNLYIICNNSAIDFFDLYGERIIVQELVSGDFGYFHIYDESGFGFWKETKYIASLRYSLNANSAITDKVIAEYLAYRKIGLNTTISDVLQYFKSGVLVCELAIRITNEPLDTILSVGEFIEEPNLITAASILPFIPGTTKKILPKQIKRHPKFGIFYFDGNLWWTKDLAEHGGSAFKAYRKRGNKLEWVGDFSAEGIRLNKHKGDTGKYIKIKDLIK